MGPIRLLRGRRPVLSPDRIHWHVPYGARQRARGGRGSRHRRAACAPDRVPDRGCGRDVHCRPGPVRRRGGGVDLQGKCAERAGGIRLRCRPARHVHACRGRHLHQGGRRGRGSCRQGREGHPGGRPPQRGHHCRQRRRQRGRLRGYGRRPVRVLRGDAGRLTHPRQSRLWERGPGLPAHRADDRRDHGSDRDLRCRPAERRPERHERNQPRLLRIRGDLGDRRGYCRLRLPARQLQRPQRDQ